MLAETWKFCRRHRDEITADQLLTVDADDMAAQVPGRREIS